MYMDKPEYDPEIVRKTRKRKTWDTESDGAPAVPLNPNEIAANVQLVQERLRAQQAASAALASSLASSSTNANAAAAAVAQAVLAKPGLDIAASKGVTAGGPASVPAVGTPTSALGQALAAGLARRETRVHVGSVSFDVHDEELRAIFSPFGTVLSCQLIPNPDAPGKHKGYGFVEYATEESAQQAIAAMNGFQLGGRSLRVTKATSSGPPQLPPAIAAAAAVAAQIALRGTAGAAGPVAPVLPTVAAIQAAAAAAAARVEGKQTPGAALEGIAGEEGALISGGAARAELMKKLARSGARSRVCLLRNMVTPAEVDPDLEAEVGEECGKYGPVERVVVHVDAAAAAVRIFVAFAGPEEAARAVAALDGRFFAGRTVRAEMYDAARFFAKDYAG